MTLRKTVNKTARKTLRKTTVLTKHSMTLRNNRSEWTHQYIDKYYLNKIKINYLFTEHSYGLLNNILLSDDYKIHPLLPVFMLTEALSSTISNLNDTNLFDDYYDYYYFLSELHIYISKELPFIDYPVFGLILRYFLFTNLYLYLPQFSVHYNETRHFFTFTNMLTTYISGTVIDNPSFDIDTSHRLVGVFLSKLKIYEQQHNFQMYKHYIDNASIKRFDRLKNDIEVLKRKIKTSINNIYPELNWLTQSTKA